MSRFFFLTEKYSIYRLYAFTHTILKQRVQYLDSIYSQLSIFVPSLPSKRYGFSKYLPSSITASLLSEDRDLLASPLVIAATRKIAISKPTTTSLTILFLSPKKKPVLNLMNNCVDPLSAKHKLNFYR